MKTNFKYEYSIAKLKGSKQIVFFLFLFVGVCLILISCSQSNKNISFSELKFMDIGSSTQSGSNSVDAYNLQMKAGGADIWGTHDEFRFGYKTIKGDFDVSVQVLGLSKANLYTKAGIMARFALSDDSPHVYFQVFPDNSPRNNNNGGCEFQYRENTAVEMKAIYPDLETAGNKFDVNYPNTWIRLIRTGNLFESFCSNDGKEWDLYSSYSQVLPEELYVGLAVTSHNSDEYTEAGFSSLKMN